MQQEFIVTIESDCHAHEIDVRHLIDTLTHSQRLPDSAIRVEVKLMRTSEALSRPARDDTGGCKICGAAPCDHALLRQDLEWLKRDNAELLRMLAEPPEVAAALEAARIELDRLRHPLAEELPDPEQVRAKMRAMSLRAREEVTAEEALNGAGEHA